MKKVILIISTLIAFSSCTKEEVIIIKEPSEPSEIPIVGTNNISAYWGCWSQSDQPTSYQILLTEETTIPHGFQYGLGCVGLLGSSVRNIGVFRNDTLICYDGASEDWFKFAADTMYHGNYSNTVWLMKLIK